MAIFKYFGGLGDCNSASAFVLDYGRDTAEMFDLVNIETVGIFVVKLHTRPVNIRSYEKMAIRT